MKSDVERSNTRLYHRYRLATPVTLTTLGPGQPEIVLGRTLEMSEAGVEDCSHRDWLREQLSVWNLLCHWQASWLASKEYSAIALATATGSNLLP
jgi:hypothetical protein